MPASYEQAEALQEQMRALQLKIEEQQSKLDEYHLKLNEINSYVKPDDSGKMTWEKFMRRLNEQLGTRSKRYVSVFNKLRAKLDDAEKLAKQDELMPILD